MTRYYQANDIILPYTTQPMFGTENNRVSENIVDEMSNYPGSKTFCMNDNDCQPHENCRFNKCIVYVY
uniref:Uncharacterized protein n=1 Tax=Panagrolaimus superbus TaxID=310955 RepID=A0A914XRN6_9BILA